MIGKCGNISDVLSAEKISKLIGDGSVRVSVFDVIDSTNSEARRQAELGMSIPALIISDAQSAGRGRMGRSFFSPPATGLYLSFLAEAKADFADTVRLTTAAAVAVAASVEELCGIEVGIKWVNDIYYRGRKICGILCESFASCSGKRYAVIGIGINLYTETFPDDIRNRAASLMPRGGMRNSFAASIARNLSKFWKSPDNPAIIEYYRARSVVLGKRVVFTEDGVEREAQAISVDDFGGLRVRLDDGSEKVLTGGEISLRVEDK